ncbi:YrhK family protein [Henriciella marina]|uniref:YrhK family protein n=1 Tax=Henriciella marina TaxID=453851 RepID=UPI0003811B89|nr:YrhK family protein [Henriciella marina]
MSRQSRSWMNFDTDKHGQVYGNYQKLYDGIDALAAFAFIIGSALFFSEKTQTIGTWLFLIGSVFFAVRPCIHVARDFHMARLSPAGDAGGNSQS